MKSEWVAFLEFCIERSEKNPHTGSAPKLPLKFREMCFALCKITVQIYKKCTDPLTTHLLKRFTASRIVTTRVVVRSVVRAGPVPDNLKVLAVVWIFPGEMARALNQFPSEWMVSRDPCGVTRSNIVWGR